MDMPTAMLELQSKFKYTADRSTDKWKVPQPDKDGIIRGDCEDYCFSVLFLICDKSWIKFFWTILFGQYDFWYVGVGSDYLHNGTRRNNGHMVMEDTFTLLMADVNMKKPVVRKVLEDSLLNYNFKKTFGRFYVFRQLIRGKMIRG